jgi:hypothetical protein
MHRPAVLQCTSSRAAEWSRLHGSQPSHLGLRYHRQYSAWVNIVELP